MVSCEWVSELGSSESDDGNGSGLEGSGSSHFDEALSIWGLYASSPLCLEFDLWSTFARSLIVFFMDDTLSGIACGNGSESVLVDGISGTLDNLFEFILACFLYGVFTISNKVGLGNFLDVLLRAFTGSDAFLVQISLGIDFLNLELLEVKLS